MDCPHFFNAGISLSAFCKPTQCRRMSGVKDTKFGTVDETLSTGLKSGCVEVVWLKDLEDDCGSSTGVVSGIG